MRIGWALCGSFCTLAKAAEAMRQAVAAGHEVTPIFSYATAQIDTRFGTAEGWYCTFEEISGKRPLDSLTAVEPIGPKGWFDLLVVAPCTGATVGKLANGISDTPVTLAVKSHLRSGKPVLAAISTNDALGGSFRSIATLKNTKNVYLVPMRQDDPIQKPNSMVADLTLLPQAAEAAVGGKQIQPLFV